jgi:hypothetical protein
MAMARPPLGAQSSTEAGGHAGTSGGAGVSEDSPGFTHLEGNSMLLTVKDLALQLQIKPATLYAWAAQEKIPYLKIHGVIRFESESIKDWLNAFGVSKRTQRLVVGSRTGTGESVEALIARAQRAVYTSCRGNQTNSEPK